MSPGTLALWGALAGAIGATVTYLIVTVHDVRQIAPALASAGTNGKNGHAPNGKRPAATNGNGRTAGALAAPRPHVPSPVLPAARACFVVAFGMMAIASASLMTLILRHDFSSTYVQEFSSRDLRFGYLIASFWAGQQGTFFLWSLYMGILGLIVMRTAREYEAPVLAIASMMNLALLMVLIIKNPFALLNPVPPDGQGLNPLLQNYWMRIHPPTLFLGFSSAIWPFAFAVAGLWRRDYSGWARRALPWAALNFAVLGAGVSLGGFWAYEVLGWNGYWGWDNVENASLMPWIGATMLLHGLLVQRLRNKWHRTNFILALIPFTMVLYASFLTRSGVLEKFSVHSFSSLGLTGHLGAWIAWFAAIGLGSLAWRWREIPRSPSPEAGEAVNRESVMGWAVGLFALLLTIVCLGTSAPVISGTLAGLRGVVPSLTWLPVAASNVGADFYKRTTTPLAILFGIGIGLVALLPWRGGSRAQLAGRIRIPALLTLAAAVLAYVLGVRAPWMLALTTAGAFAVISNGRVLLKSPRNVRKLGGYVAHVGVGLFLIGTVAANFCDRHQRLNLVKDQPASVFGYQATFTNYTGNVLDPESHLDIKFQRPGEQFVAHPPMYFAQSQGKPMIAPAIHHYLFHDLYIEPLDMPHRSDEPARVEIAKGARMEVVPGVVLQPILFKADRRRGLAGALVDVTYDGGKTARLTPGIINFTSPNAEFVPSATPDGRVQVQIITFHVSDNTIELAVSGTAVVPPGPVFWFQPVEVSIKPLIRFVWLGEILTVIGGLLTLFQRLRELRRQEAATTDASPEPQAAPNGAGREQVGAGAGVG